MHPHGRQKNIHATYSGNIQEIEGHDYPFRHNHDF